MHFDPLQAQAVVVFPVEHLCMCVCVCVRGGGGQQKAKAMKKPRAALLCQSQRSSMGSKQSEDWSRIQALSSKT